jgi:(R)-2-hydroxyglutarate---pyruvate transhydrogenase
MNVAVFSLPSYEAVQKVFNTTKSHLGEILSAFEFFDRQAYELVMGHKRKEAAGGEIKKVFEKDGEGEFYVLVETGGSNSGHDEEVCMMLWLVEKEQRKEKRKADR